MGTCVRSLESAELSHKDTKFNFINIFNHLCSLPKAKLPGKGLQELSIREESQLLASVTCLGSPSQSQALETDCPVVLMTPLSRRHSPQDLDVA